MKVTAIKIMLMAQDMRRAIDFYHNAFGFVLKMHSDHWSELAAGGSFLSLHDGHDGSPNRVSLGIEVDDIKDVMNWVLNHGGRIVVAPLRREGEPIIYGEFADTEGNIVMLTQYVGEP